MTVRGLTRQLIYSRYDESASGALSYGDSGELSNSNLDQSVLLRDVSFEASAVYHDNTDRIDAPEGLPDELEIDKWVSSGRFSGEADIDLLAVVAGNAIGPASSSLVGGSVDVHDHVIVPRAQADLDNPESVSMAFGSDTDHSKYNGCVVNQFSIRGGQHQFVTMQADIIGSGRRTTMTSYTPPAARYADMLRDSQGIIKLGTQGSPENITDEIIEWGFTWQNRMINDSELSIDMITDFDVSDDSKGWLLAEQEIASRGLTFFFVIEYDDLTPIDQMENLTAREIDISVLGDEIESGFFNSLSLSVKDVRITNPRMVVRNGQLAWQFDGAILIDSLGTLADYFKMTIRNDVNAYGLLQA